MAFQHIQQPEAYDIIPGTEHELGDLTPRQLKLAGVDVVAEDDGPPSYWLRGEELDAETLVIVPAPDPVPHYNRGRTYIEPFPTSGH
jgi:hypothetical protein